MGDITWLGVERSEGEAREAGRPVSGGDRVQESEPEESRLFSTGRPRADVVETPVQETWGGDPAEGCSGEDDKRGEQTRAE